jgi:hypothetical protein
MIFSSPVVVSDFKISTLHGQQAKSVSRKRNTQLHLSLRKLLIKEPCIHCSSLEYVNIGQLYSNIYSAEIFYLYRAHILARDKVNKVIHFLANFPSTTCISNLRKCAER